MKVSGICLSVCLLLAAGSQEVAGDSHGGRMSEELGEITFECRRGWEIYQGDCYLFVDKPMTAPDALATCHSVSAFPWFDQADYFKLPEGLHISGKIWTGLRWETDANGWYYDGEPYLQQHIPYWNDYQPNIKAEQTCTVRDSDGLTMENCENNKHPFVCTYPACPKGFMRCARDKRCISRTIDLCDDINDCSDRSDERECPDKYRHYDYLEQKSGSIDFPTLTRNLDYTHELEAHIGEIIKLTIPPMNGEPNITFIEVMSYNPVDESYNLQKQLTGSWTRNQVVYSDQHVLILRVYRSGVGSTPPINTNKFIWTTDIPELFGSKDVTAISDYQSLDIPFGRAMDPAPTSYELYWDIKAPQVISFNLGVKDETLDVSGQIPFSFFDGEYTSGSAYSQMEMGTYYISGTSMLRVKLNMAAGMTRNVYVEYKSGCTLNILESDGTILSPGYSRGVIPHDLECKWTMTKGNSMNPDRGMTVTFSEINLEVDDRNAAYKDSLEVFTDGSTEPVSVLQVDSTIHSASGRILMNFKSDYFLESNKFKAYFGTDCEALDLSDTTSITPETTYSAQDVTLSCPTGYEFNYEYYKSQSQLTIRCFRDNWYDIAENQVIVPQCQIKNCGTPTAVNNGYIVSATGSTFGSTVIYECDKGFNMTGSDTAECKDTGKWILNTECKFASCLALPQTIIPDGKFEIIEGNEFSNGDADFGTIIEFSCDPGYELIGWSISHCNQSGWTHGSNTPTCKRLRCTLPEVENGLYDGGVSEVQFEGTKVVRCNTGYKLTSTSGGSELITCQANQTFDKEPACEDIDECDQNTDGCQDSTTDCVNTIGSYLCNCKTGYERNSRTSCTDINECSIEGTCFHDCFNSPPGSYSCSCRTGYDLFTENGLHGFYTFNQGGLVTAFGDNYVLNYTCVPRSCPQLENPENGMYGQKIDNKLFYVGEMVELHCDDGYRISGLASSKSASQSCQTVGTWSTSRTCSAMSCSIPFPPLNGEYTPASGSISFGDTLALNCTLRANEFVERKAKCIIDPGNTAVQAELGGDNINACPEIDCGDPNVVSPGGANTFTPLSTKHLNANSRFTFSCGTGYDEIGSSEEGDAPMDVRCKANGKWGYGTLSCDGKKCPDPGTPGGAWQNVTSYEIGQKLTYVCDMDGKSGFAPLFGAVEQEYTCNLNLVGEGEWCCGLSKNNLPVCTDVTNPVITGCPEAPIVLYPMDEFPALNLAASDNFGVKSFKSNSDLRAGDTVLSSQTIIYTATDFEGLFTPCNVVIRVIDIEADKPTLTCPDNIPVTVQKDVTSINITDTYGNLITSNGEVTISPTMVYPSINKIGEHDVINVKATNEFGLESSCTFLVNYPGMNYCDQAAIYPDNLRQSITFEDAPNGGMEATGTCRSGNVYKTGENTKVFTCTPATGWTYNPEDIFCLPYTDPTTGFDATVYYKLSRVASSCLDPFANNIRASVGTIKGYVENLPACSGTNWDISSSAESTTTDLVTLQATLSFSHGSLSAEQRDACWTEINNDKTVFLFASSISCGVNKPSTVTVDEIFAISIPELKCAATSYYFTTSSVLGQICIPCGPGYSYDSISDGCTQCGVDQYTTLTNQYTCATCPNGADATAIKIECKGTCPAGYYSNTGMFPCVPCPVDTYWTDSKTCTACPSSGSTLGVEGAEDQSACHAPCEAGQFSRTGYSPCSSCGNHFFTSLQAQTECSECPGHQTTTNSTIATTNDCFNLPADQSDHRMVNRSTTGLIGRLANIIDSTPVNNLLGCETWCLAISSCEEVTYFDNGESKNCVSYPSGVPLDADNDAVAAVHMRKERDLVCDRSDCNNNGDCDLLHHRRHCTCDEGYTGDQCQTFINICDLSPCLNGVVCVGSGTFNQYECTCPDDRSKYVMRDSTVNGNEVIDASNPVNAAVGLTKSQCETFCIETENCEVAGYAVRNDGSTCGLYGTSPPLVAPAASVVEYFYMVKDRSPGQPVGGTNCGKDLIDSCTESECSERSMCMDQVDGYKCLCPVSGGLEGTYCKETDDPCSPNPCQQGSCAAFGAVRYVCTCNPGYEGINCDIDIDECDLNPGACLNGGTCNNLVNRYTCSCAGNYRGPNCEEVPNFCGVNCLGNNVCISSNNGGAMCQCDSKYFDTTQDNRCEEIASPCKDNACVNGTCSPNGYDKYAYSCTCDVGSIGSLCQRSRDDCLGVECNHGTCVDGHRDYTCVCEAGYTGDSCLDNINDCVSDPCDVDHGTCKDLVDGYECVCEAGFDGADCSTNIDECLSYPCQHGGICNDGNNGYTCQCPDGWTGDNCESEIGKCAGTPCNTGKCYSLPDKYVCICGGGTQGDNCEARNSVCALLNNFDPPLCGNGGICSNVGDTAKCNCKAEHIASECFFEDGQENANYQELISEDLIIRSREQCQALCLNNIACGSYTHTPESHCFLHPTTAETKTVNEGDTLYVKVCPSHFSGDSCQYNKDWCSDNPCKNGATCIPVDPIGYTCSCQPGFTGKRCDVYMDPCDQNPCGSSSLVQCQSSDTRNICKCQEGQTFTGQACARSEKFVILVDNLDGKADRASLQTPFSISSTAFSVMMWVRVHATADGFTLLKVIGENSLHPNEDTATFEIVVDKLGVKVDYNGVSKVLLFSKEYINADVFDGDRHFVGIAINSDGKMSANIDTTAAISEADLEQNFQLDHLNMNIFLGDGVVAEYSRLIVYDKYFSRENFTAVKTQGESYQADFSPIQDWGNWILPYKSRWMIDWLEGTLAIDNSKDEPGVDCSGFGNSEWSVVPDDKYLLNSDLTAFSGVYESLKTDYGSLAWSSSMPSVLEWGRYNAIVMAANTTTGRYSECRAPVYVKYNENCPAYINRDSPQVLDSQCSGNSGVCSVSCRDSTSYSLSSPFPNTVPCGPLGVYDPRHPWRTLVLPTCTLRASPKHTVYLKLFYGFSNTDCSTGVDNIDTVEARLKLILNGINGINTNWLGICDDTACSNFMFGKAVCSSTVSMKMDIEFSMKFVTNTLQYRENGIPGITLSIIDVFRTTLLAEGKFDLSSVAGAQLLEDEVDISTFDGCDTGNTLLYNSDDDSWYCAPCGKGHYVSSETNTCELCAPGSYQDKLNMESCKSCGDTTTNYEYGHVSQASCIEICQAGEYREDGQCKECKRHTYQSQTGKTYCDYCDLGTKTAATGSTSKADCKPDCPAGEYRTVEHNCKICPRGKWRSPAIDDCQPCPVGYTTYDGQLAASSNDCEMEICDLGAFWNRSDKVCVNCDFGFYNDEQLALSCKACDGNMTTQEQKSDSSADCTFYCAAGYEVDSSGDKKCKACPRGYYKSNIGAAKFGTCTMCSEDTTDDIAITTAEECNVPMCKAGEHIVEGVCLPCPMDFWSDVAEPYTSTQCEPCSCELCDKKGTLKPGANSSDLCMRYCDPGMELLEGECEMCKRGYYKDNVGEARFQMCKACSDDGSIITDDVGSDNNSYCVIPNCEAGQFVFEDNSVYACQNCSKDSYQIESSPVSSVTCTACPALGDVPQGTMYTGARAVDECKPICLGGKQFDGEKKMCTDCPIGDYKLATSRFGTCMDCPDSRFTTREPGADSAAMCELRDCGPGTYIAVDNNGNADCVNCSNTQCEYQDERWQTECKSCGTNLCTLYPGAKSQDDCTIFCGAGLEGTETCEPCKDGYFKAQSGYGQCLECPPGFTSSQDDRTACNLRNCWYGTEYVNEGGVENCIDCGEGSYKDVIGNVDTCQQCAPSYTTDGPAQRNCTLRNCLPGTTLTDGDCVECAIGTYKSETGNMVCTECLTNRTTDGTGKTSQAQCDIAICPPGQYRVEKLNCARCPVNKYQPDSGKTSCIDCANGQITMQQESTTQDQCVPECQKGEQYNATTKLCDPCKVGYYKNVVGNTQACVACDSGRTTIGEGSDSSADCSQTVCPAGKYSVRTTTEIVCVECAIGFYNPSTGKDSCIGCLPDFTTFKTGRVDSSDCFKNCVLGYGFKGNNAEGGNCQQCLPGTYNDRTGSNKNLCKKCPFGKTNLAKGSTSCDYGDTTPARDTFVDVTIILVYEVELDSCDVTYLSPALNAIRGVLRVLFFQSQIDRYGGNNPNRSYCNNGCLNMIVRRRPTDNSCRMNRRKRAIHTLEVEAIFQNASGVVEDTTDNNQEISTPDALYQVLVHNEEELTPVELINTNGRYVTENPDSGIITTQEICSSGEVSVADVCTPCSAGEYWENRACVKCPVDTYQNQTGQISCIACPLDTYHDLNRQTSQTACKSYCTSTNYCNNRGSCTSTGRRTASCTCFDDYNGDRCEAKAKPSSDMDVILGLAIGGGGGLLMIILAIVGVYKCLTSKDGAKKKSKRYNANADPEYYPENIYDNYSQSRGLAPFPSVGYPALGYRPDPSVHEDSPYTAVYKNPGFATDANKSQNEDTFVWQA